MRNKILSVAGAVLLACLAGQYVAADGLVFRPIDYEGSLNERSQEAIIVFHKGDKAGEARQDLILKISVKGDVDQFGWVVPLPSAPETGKEDAKLFEELHKYVQARLVAGGGRPKKEDGLNSAGEAAPATAEDVEVTRQRRRAFEGDATRVDPREGHVVGVGPLSVVPEHVVSEMERDLGGIPIHVP